jgi:hypothetical protein
MSGITQDQCNRPVKPLILPITILSRQRFICVIREIRVIRVVFFFPGLLIP